MFHLEVPVLQLFNKRKLQFINIQWCSFDIKTILVTIFQVSDQDGTFWLNFIGDIS